MARQRAVHAKPVVYRRAVAEGLVRLSAGTLAAIRAGKVEKGDPLSTAEVAGLAAMKRTPELIPHCHVVPLTASSVELEVRARDVRAQVVAEALWRTGAEMEALVGVTVSLLTVWDMVKYLEKDEAGGYPNVRLQDVRVVSKTKTEAEP